jgi:hypothetical protein
MGNRILYSVRIHASHSSPSGRMSAGAIPVVTAQHRRRQAWRCIARDRSARGQCGER